MVEAGRGAWITRWSRAPLSALPALFLLLGLPLGFLFAIILPPLQAPDEVAHFYRAYNVSTGACVPPAYQNVPFALNQLQNGFPARVERSWPVHFQDYRALMHSTWREGEDAHIRNVSANTYTCIPYLAAAVGLELAKITSQSALMLLYGARLANLLLYLGLTYLALRILPVGQLILFCLALMPMTLHQAASASADAPTIATSFLFIAYVTYLAFDPRIITISPRQITILVGLLLIDALCKFNGWLLLLSLLIPAKKLGTTKRKAALVCGMFALFAISALSWQHIDHSNYAQFDQYRASMEVYQSRNLNFVWKRPLDFSEVLLRSWTTYGYPYAVEFVGKLGWVSVPLPDWVTPVYLLMLFLAASVIGQASLLPGARVIAGVVFLGSFVSTFIVLWVLEMTQPAYQYIETHRALITGVQGRYFIPFALTLFLFISNNRLRWHPKLIVTACAAIIVTVDSTALVTIYRSFYRDVPPPRVLDAMIPDRSMRRTAGPLHDGDSFSQSFVPHSDYLSRVELAVATYGKTIPSGWLRIRLLDLSNNHEIASWRTPLTSIRDNASFDLDFTPIPNSRNKSYMMALEPVQLPAGYSVTVWLSDEDVYPEGASHLNGRDLGADTAFRTYVSPPSVLRMIQLQ